MSSQDKTHVVIRLDVSIYLLLTASDKRKVSDAILIIKGPFCYKDIDSHPLTSVQYVFHHENQRFASLLLAFILTALSLKMFVDVFWFPQDSIYYVPDKMSANSSTCFLKKTLAFSMLISNHNFAEQKNKKLFLFLVLRNIFFMYISRGSTWLECRGVDQLQRSMCQIRRHKVNF